MNEQQEQQEEREPSKKLKSPQVKKKTLADELREYRVGIEH